MEHPLVCLPTDVTAVERVATSVEASLRSGATLSRRGSVRASRLPGLSCATSQRFGVVLVVLPRLFARCLALEGLSRSEVVSVSWDPHPREPVEGGIRATSVLKLAAHTRASGGSRFDVLSVPWSRSWVPARDGTGVCSFPTWRCVRGPGWCAEHCFHFVPDSVEFLLLWPVRDWSSVSDGLRRRLWCRVVVSSSESECCELLYPSELRVMFCKSSGYAP
ncbi:hypothetical protein Taro_003908 [Colocasia esculenta]|uniref:Uncharacterized protein n=1 Tax=Colocasia esculenta TaxID=4460 RepID=A0A843TQ81_COLES|nr:hypothetical protein [Colocasia esculenta]